MSGIRRHVSYANVVATLALVFAMGGSAIAAKHYIISSTKQIKPSVLRQLKRAGSRGAAGSRGSAGPQGAAGGEGKRGLEGVTGLSAAELATLKAMLPHMSYVSSGIAGQPTVQFSGVNVQVLSGAGTEEALNGAGNLVIGYDQDPEAQTGSNNLILGRGQSFTSVGGIDAGVNNQILAPFASVLGGAGNKATGEVSSVGGGEANGASGVGATVEGGGNNSAVGGNSSVTGGGANIANGPTSSVSGGGFNTATGGFSSVGGGEKQNAIANFEFKP